MLRFNLQSFLQAKEKERGKDPERAWGRGAGHTAGDSLFNQAAAGQASCTVWLVRSHLHSAMSHTVGRSLPLLDPMEFTGSTQRKHPVSKVTLSLGQLLRESRRSRRWGSLGQE